MNNESYYAIKLSFHPEAKTEELKTFNSLKAAEEYASHAESGGDCWVIVEKIENSFAFCKGIEKPKSHG